MAIETTAPQPYVTASGGQSRTPYEQWIASTGVPIHRGYYIEDARTIELGPWPERECNAAFLVLAGQEGVSEARITEIAPGTTLPPLKFALDEVIYVVEGRGLTTVWAGEGGPKKTFEWQKHSMFLVPRGTTYQISSTQGNQPARLLHYNYLPIAMNIVPDPGFYFANTYIDPKISSGEDYYSEAKSFVPEGSRTGRVIWYGNFFPDMRAWDRLHTYEERGAGGLRVGIQFANSTMWSHMSVFPSRTYKKGHRHGPGVVIIIPGGEGYSIMWEEGKEKVVVPWHEGSVFVPPNRWFHQHFNLGATYARYLAFHAPRGVAGRSERVEDLARDQIEYPDEDPFIRNKFETELKARGLSSLMPNEAYRDRDYKWDYGEGD
ncbi:MAG TPA: cupin domain-containing protein [Chloroflexota bacterium]|nr:cupin domain-containing protein [Chloroflexota bacterium]